MPAEITAYDNNIIFCYNVIVKIGESKSTSVSTEVFYYVYGMKRLFLFFFFVPVIGFSQSEPVKGANKILVSLSDTANIMQRVSLALYKKGYSIKQKDESLHFIATNSKGLNNAPSEITIHVLIADKTAIISGQAATVSMGNKLMQDVEYSGAKNSTNRIQWDELESIANVIGSNIQYRKE